MPRGAETATIPPPRIEADAAGVALHCADDIARAFEKAQRAGPALQGDDRDPVARRPLVLHGDSDRVVPPHGEMTDAEPVQVRIEFQFPDQGTAPPVDGAQGWRHGGQVEFDARQVRMRRDAAVGNDEGLAVGKQRDLVRADAVGRKFAQAPVAALRVVDADDAAFVLEIVPGGVEQPAVAAEHAMPVVAAVGLRHQRACDGAPRKVQRQCKASRPPREMHRLESSRSRGERVTPARLRQIEADNAVSREAADPVAAGGVGPGAEVKRRALGSCFRADGHRHQGAGKAAGEQPQRVPAVSRHRER